MIFQSLNREVVAEMFDVHFGVPKRFGHLLICPSVWGELGDGDASFPCDLDPA